MLTFPPEPWESLIHEWSKWLESDGKSERTIRNYVDAARWFHLWLAEQPDPPAEPDEIQPEHVRDWIRHRLAETSRGNVNNNYRSLQPWFGWLLHEGEITTNPMAGMKPPKVPEKPIPVVPDDLLTRVLDTCTGRDLLSRRDTALVRLIFDTGARLSEIAHLTVDDVDLKLDVIYVVGKGGKARAIPFSPKTSQALSRYLRKRRLAKHADRSELWLADRNRGVLKANGIKLMLRRRGNEAGITGELGRNLHAHLGRHYASHHWQAAGGSVPDLMLMMGWSTPQMAHRYGRSAAIERAHASARKLRLGDRF